MAVNWQQYTQRTTAGAGGTQQSLKTYSGKTALSATLTTTIPLETVPTGKTFYITDIFLSHDAAIVADVHIDAAGTPIFRAPVKGDTAPAQMPGLETQPFATAGQQVNLVYPPLAGPPNAYYYIGGFEQ